MELILKILNPLKEFLSKILQLLINHVFSQVDEALNLSYSHGMFVPILNFNKVTPFYRKT